MRILRNQQGSIPLVEIILVALVIVAIAIVFQQRQSAESIAPGGVSAFQPAPVTTVKLFYAKLLGTNGTTYVQAHESDYFTSDYISALQSMMPADPWTCVKTTPSYSDLTFNYKKAAQENVVVTENIPGAGLTALTVTVSGNKISNVSCPMPENSMSD